MVAAFLVILSEFQGTSYKTSSRMDSRFGTAGKEEILVKRDQIHAKATQKANMKAVRSLREYLKSRNEPTEFENLNNGELDELLSHFYINARRINGEKYKISSLENIRFSLNRYMQGIRDYRIDLIRDSEFRNSNVSFRAATQELKREGKGQLTIIQRFPKHISDKYIILTFLNRTRQLTYKTKFNLISVFILLGEEEKTFII